MTCYVPPGTALDVLMLYLHLGGVSCRGRRSNYSHWYSLSLPADGNTTRTWCGANMSRLDPDLLKRDQATSLIELQNTLSRKLYRGVIDFRVASQSIPPCAVRGVLEGAHRRGRRPVGDMSWARRLVV